MLGNIFERFVEHSPVSVMVRGLMERVFAPDKLDTLFEATAQVQYTRALLFSNLVEMMSLVVCGIHPSVNAAYRAKAKELGVSRSAVYDKLNGIESQVSAAMVRDTAAEMAPLIEAMTADVPDWVSGYQTRISDGTCLAGTDHRLEVLQDVAAKALPGKCLVVFDPKLKLVRDVFICEDGHGQERTLFPQWLATVEAQQLWIADRNMSTLAVLFSIHQRQAAFVIRQHQLLPWQAEEELRPIGRTETGAVFEQAIVIHHQGQSLHLRRIVVHLFKPTRDGEMQISLLTNLPSAVADALTIARLYRRRWTIETFFQQIEAQLNGEIQTLAYPPAALFSFCLALVTANILAVVQAALGWVHGVGKVEASLSLYYVVDEVQATYRGMMIAIEPPEWTCFALCSDEQLLATLHQLASQVDLLRFLKQPRAAKKPKPRSKPDPNQPHVSTHRLLHKQKNAP
jgi:IS4 transposase